MSDKMPKQFTELEKEALRGAMLITSYSPNSAWANESPSLYALMFHHARRVMQAAGIEPHTNIQCWFWQIDAAYQPEKAENNDQEIERASKRPSPTLDEHGMWVGPDGQRLNDRAFVQLYPNDAMRMFGSHP